MKTPQKDKKIVKNTLHSDSESNKPKKKLQPMEQKGKVNLKSKRFWEDIIDDEGEDIERFLR